MLDCVVVGGGLAGMVAARRLQELDMTPVVLEKSTEDGGGGNARISGGLVHLAWASMDESAVDLRARLDEETDGEIEPELAEVLAENAGRAMAWLTEQGVETRPKGDVGYMKFALYPHRPGTGRRIRREFGPDKMMMRLYENVRSAGGDIRLGAVATGLRRMDSNDSYVVTYSTKDGGQQEVEARTVVVADGGFQANHELLAQYVGPNAGLCVLRGMATGTGDGLTMLLEAGGTATGLGRVYGHMVSLDALHNDELWPYPALDKLCLDGLLIGRRGNRLDHDATTGVELVTLLARGEDPRGTTLLFDDELWSTAGADNPYNSAVPNPDLVDRGAEVFTADSIEALAGQLGLNPAILVRSVEEHNVKGVAPRIEKAPFHATKVIPGITYTMGGVRIDSGCAVLSRDGVAMTGLYAAGSATGGVDGGPHGGYAGGLAVALEQGLLAAEGIVRQLSGAGAHAEGAHV